MRLVVRRTGLSPDVLRVWERRYGVVQPVRSAGGQRLYSTADIERLVLLHRAARAGYGIARAAQLTPEELKVVAASMVEGAGSPREYGGMSPESIATSALAAVESFDAATLEAQLRRASTLFSSDEFLEEVLGPLLHVVGSRWHEGAISPAHEHLATTTVRRVLDWLGATLEAEAEAPLIAVATLAGEAHEMGAMFVARVAAECGWRVRYFGAGLPPDHLASAAAQLGARVVAISVVNMGATHDAAMLEQIHALRTELPDSAIIMAGGRGAKSLGAQLDAQRVVRPDGMPGLREELRRHALG